MIIGISGKIGSGKDTVGKIIQYLTSKESNRMSYSSFCSLEQRWHNPGDWDIKKFASKLKQIVSILTGIPIEDLEKEEVKNAILNENWTRYAIATGFTKDNHGNTTMLTTDCSKERYNEELKINWQTAYQTKYTVRYLLQRIGTEAMRNIIHPDIWVNALFVDYKLVSQQMNTIDFRDMDTLVSGKSVVTEVPNWIITDVRFPNELKAIKDHNGISIRVNRSNYPYKCDTCGYEVSETQAFHDGICPFCKKGTIVHTNNNSTHPSETALDNATFDYTINNNGTISDLIEMVRLILVNSKIITNDIQNV